MPRTLDPFRLLRRAIRGILAPSSLFAATSRLIRELVRTVLAVYDPVVMGEFSGQIPVHGIAVALLSEDGQQLSALQSCLEATRLGRAVFSHVGFPTGPADSILRQLQESRAEVVVVDVSARDVQRAVRVIELIKATTLQIAIFASGEMTQPAGIVASMRAGAGEYVDSSAGSDALLEALTRFKQAHARVEKGLPTLTALEREIIRLLAEGNSSKEVASLLNLSTTTVETHRSNIMRKLSCHSIRDLVVYATKNNLIQIERAGFLEKGQWLNVSSISDVMELQPLQLKLSVVIVATNTEQRAQLQALVDGTKVARSVHACPNFPVASDDPVTQRVRAANPDVILVDIPVDKSQSALRAIELLHQEVPESAIFAIGRPSQAKVNVNAIRAGAREFIERPTTTADLLEAFARLTTRSPPPGLLS